MNYYERHLGDYAKDTAHLSMLEHGAYNLLLDRYYSTETGIPASQAHRLARARTKEEKQAVDDVLAEFFTLTGDVWINKRSDEEIIKAQAKINAAKENGKRGGRPKKSKQGSENETQQKPSGLFMGSENETQQKPHQTPDTRHQTSKQPPPVTDRESGAKKAVVAAVPSADIAIPETPTTEGHWMVWFNRETGTQYDASSRFDRSDLWPIFGRWCKAGITQQQMRVAIKTAQETATAPIANLPKYVDRVLANSQTPQRISHSDQSKLAASRAIFGTEIEGEQHGQSNRIIDVTPTVTEIGSGQDFSGDARKLRQPVLESVEDRTDHPGRH